MNKLEVLAKITKYKALIVDVDNDIRKINKKMEKLTDMEEEYIKNKNEIESNFGQNYIKTQRITEKTKSKAIHSIMARHSKEYYENNPMLEDIQEIISKIRKKYLYYDDIKKEKYNLKKKYESKLEFYKDKLFDFTD